MCFLYLCTLCIWCNRKADLTAALVKSLTRESRCIILIHQAANDTAMIKPLTTAISGKKQSILIVTSGGRRLNLESNGVDRKFITLKKV